MYKENSICIVRFPNKVDIVYCDKRFHYIMGLLRMKKYFEKLKFNYALKYF